MGGSKTQVVSTQAAQAPSTADAVNAYIAGMPQMFQAQLDYAPKEAAQQVQLAQQYAAPLAQAIYDAQKTLYPEATKLQEQLAAQSLSGMTAGLSDAEKAQYRSDLAAQLGTNVGGGVGADYMSRGLLQAQQARQDYYRNLGLSVAGLQPTAQASMPSYTNQLQNYKFGDVTGYMGNTYGSWAGSLRSNVMPGQSSPFGQIAGSMVGSGLGAFTGGLGSNLADSFFKK